MKEDVGTVFDEVGIPDCLDARKIEKVMRRTFKRIQRAVKTVLRADEQTVRKTFARYENESRDCRGAVA